MAAVMMSSAPALAADSVTVYSYRQPFLIDPILQDFTAKTGIEVDVVFAKDGIAERLTREGRLSPADLVLTSDFSRLMELVDKHLVQPLDSTIIDAAIPAQFRSPDDLWFSLTKRVRNIYSSKARLGAIDINYEDLASPQFKGKICTRSGKHPYNVALVASMLAHHGEADTKAWLEGLKANLAQRPQGNDRAQVKAVKEGLCDIAIGNSYYLGSMMMDPNQQAWAQAVAINFPNQSNRGAHINVSGMAMAKHAPNRAGAQALMEYLASAEAQTKYAEVNFEYPVNPKVQPSEMVASWGQFTEDALPIQALADNHSAAVKLLDEVKFDM
ncbi:Fe(3+) ABC transporter substrate-binding protein [Shewanella sp. NIFS-20-20]|uniref:Fe(3+) ABC transporter substrate-binding protein n=1 Tax=Shewanella sp. NIFS-20-20 TaxID=2853806 RepID=UPI0035295F46